MFFSSNSDAQDCPAGYPNYGGFMKIRDLTDCCELWIEYCWVDRGEGTPLSLPYIYIKNWYFATNSLECDLNFAKEVFLHDYDIIMSEVARLVAPILESFPGMDLYPCDEPYMGDDNIVVVTSSSCWTDPYRYIDNHTGGPRLTYKVSQLFFPSEN